MVSREFQRDRELRLARGVGNAARAAADGMQLLTGQHRAVSRHAGRWKIVERALIDTRDLERGCFATNRCRHGSKPEAAMCLEGAVVIVKARQRFQTSAVEQCRPQSGRSL